MSYNGSGTFQINTSGQPVVAGTVISSTAFNALTADLATGLSTAITKDGQTTTTARIPFAAGINSSSATDSTSTATGSIITAGGVGIAKAVFIGTTLNVTGVATFSATPIYSSLTASSAVATDASKALVSVTNTGTGNNVLATSPTLVTPILGTPTSGSLVNCTDLNYTGFKNRLINSAMVIDQRNAGASVTPSATGTVYTLDRWYLFSLPAASKFSVQQVAAPAGFTGFTSSVLITTVSSIAGTAADVYAFDQALEGYNVADLKWGTAGAQAIKLSFWAQASVTGTYPVAFLAGSADASYATTFSLTANTATYVTLTIPGPTIGTYGTTNGVGFYLIFDMGSGSNYESASPGTWIAGNYSSVAGAVKLVRNASATLYLSGVQLEKGSTATSFDYRPYGTELALCQRYLPYFSSVTGTYFGTGQAYATTAAIFSLPYPVPPRTAATGITASGTFALLNNGGSGVTTTSGPSINGTGLGSLTFTFGVAAGLVGGNATQLQALTSAVIYGTGCEL